MYLNKGLAELLVKELRERCPVDTGQLKTSIQLLQTSATDWLVLIGNDNSSINGVPSNRYASITNFNKTLGKNGKANKNYHWVNKAIKAWVNANGIQFKIDGDDDDE